MAIPKNPHLKFFSSLGLVVALLLSAGLPTAAWAQEPVTEDDDAVQTLYLPLIRGTTTNSGGADVEQVTEDETVDAAAVHVAGEATMPAPSRRARVNWQAELPAVSASQQAQLEAGVNNSHLPGPARKAAPANAPENVAASTASTVIDLEQPVIEARPNEDEQAQGDLPPAPLAPGDAGIFRNTLPTIPAGFTSNVQEVSAAQGGKYAFVTGNWYAARSVNGGASWTYVNAFADMSDFCCDQVTIHDSSRNRLFWYRQSIANVNGVNYLRLGVSADGGATFCNYDVSPTNVNAAWTNQWFDYPHLQLGADYLYIATNVFNAARSWTRTVMLRWPLDALSTCTGFSYNYYQSTSWFTFVPVQGADHIMYFASNGPSVSPWNRLAIWTWRENSTTVSSVTKTVATWAWTDYQCGSSSGNWGGRTGDRLLTGARYMVHNADLSLPGRTVVGWWWNAARQSGFTQPYIEGAAFYENGLAQVAGAQGRPYIWSSSTCYLYPSVAANDRGDLGVILHYGSGTALNPSVAYGIVDDYVNAAPGFTLFAARTSNARPSDNRWGDYNTVRPFNPTGKVWIAGSHYISGSTSCASCARPVFFVFGRQRDFNSWNYWQNK